MEFFNLMLLGFSSDCVFSLMYFLLSLYLLATHTSKAMTGDRVVKYRHVKGHVKGPFLMDVNQEGGRGSPKADKRNTELQWKPLPALRFSLHFGVALVSDPI